MSDNPLLYQHETFRYLMPFHDGTKFHLFARDGDSLCHGVSMDLLRWEWSPSTPVPGEWKQDGACIVSHQGVYHLFYTASGGIGQVRSDDLLSWRPPRQPVSLKLDSAIYRRDRCRDPYVFYNQQDGLWWMLFSAQISSAVRGRSGCIGLAKSPDLERWQLVPPIWAPELGPDCDAPHLLEINRRWYLLYRKHEALYRLANAATGPYRRPPLRHLYSNHVAEGTRAVWDGDNWLTFPLAAGPAGSGTPAIPRQLTFQLDGSITEQPAQLLLDTLRQEPVQNNGLSQAQRLRGAWQPQVENSVLRCTTDTGGLLRVPGTADNCFIEADILFEKEDMDLCLIVRPDAALSCGYEIMIEPRSQQISLRNLLSADPRPLATRWVPLPVGKCVHLQIFLIGNLLDIFIDQRSSLSTCLTGTGREPLLVEFRDGKGKLGNVDIRRWPGASG